MHAKQSTAENANGKWEQRRRKQGRKKQVDEKFKQTINFNDKNQSIRHGHNENQSTTHTVYVGIVIKTANTISQSILHGDLNLATRTTNAKNNK